MSIAPRLTRHDHKVSASIARSRGCDRPVQGQQIGRIGDRTDYVEDLAGVAGLLGQLSGVITGTHDVLCQGLDRNQRIAELLQVMARGISR